VHLANLKLRDFRNYRKLEAEFEPGFHLLLGRNAQGKTNLLEAVYLLSTLRSFRGVGNSQIIHHGQSAFFAGGIALGQAECDVRYYWAPNQRKLTVNQKPIRRLADYLGALRTVVFCTEDLHLVKGSGKSRRRFLDLLLTQTRPGYLQLLHRYTESLRSRNALLKRDSPDAALLDSFTTELISTGNKLMTARRQLVDKLSPMVLAGYRKIAAKPEEVRMEYAPSIREDFVVELGKSRAREQRYRSTIVGPHRDELKLSLNGKPAAQFGSEGQKRTFSIALKMSQAEYLAEVHGTPPILLIDDVMGELDAERRAGLLPLISRTGQALGQVFMTCTEENWPSELSAKLHRWTVNQGALRRG
jgi:DNA replication and repair protein RecF